MESAALMEFTFQPEGHPYPPQDTNSLLLEHTANGRVHITIVTWSGIEIGWRESDGFCDRPNRDL